MTEKNNDRRIRIRISSAKYPSALLDIHGVQAICCSCSLPHRLHKGLRRWTMNTGNANGRNARNACCKFIQLYLDVWPSKIYTSTTLFDVNFLQKHQGLREWLRIHSTGGGQLRCKVGLWQCHPHLFTLTNPKQRFMETAGNPPIWNILKHIKDCSKASIFHILLLYIFGFLRRIRGRSKSKISWKNQNPSGVLWNLLPPRNA